MRVFLFSVSFLAALSANGEMNPVHVTLRAENAVAGAFFKLSEIATVSAGDEQLERELAALRVGRSPRAGTVLALKPVEVERVIARLKPELRQRLRVEGAQTASVRRGPLQSVEPARVRESAARALEVFLAERYSRFEIEPLGEPGGAFAVPEGRLELKPRIAAAGSVPARLTVWMELYIDGFHYQSLPVAFAVRGYQPVLAARSALRAGERVRTDELAVREEQVAGYAEAPVPADLEAATLRLKRPLAAGEVLTWRHAEQAPAVSRNQEITVRLAVGAIALEAPAVATQDARPGEVIRVRTAASRQTYSARVTGPGTAEALWR
jgi:flagellar basal body P-ring formation protein FlgA